MNNQEILALLSQLNYASVYVMSSEQRVKFGPGEWAWRKALRTATTEERAALSEKLQRWAERRSA